MENCLPYFWIASTSFCLGALGAASLLAFVPPNLRTIDYELIGLMFISGWASCGSWLILSHIIARRSLMRVLLAAPLAPFLGVLVSVGGSLLLLIRLLPILIAVSFLNSIVIYYLLPKQRAPGKCLCGYNLKGNTSGRCPECGAPVPTPGSP